MGQTIYLVQKGDGEDGNEVSVEAVFTDEAKADAFAAAMGDGYVTAWDADSRTPAEFVTVYFAKADIDTANCRTWREQKPADWLEWNRPGDKAGRVHRNGQHVHASSLVSEDEARKFATDAARSLKADAERIVRAKIACDAQAHAIFLQHMARISA